MAVVDVPWLGVEAAAELGIPLERLVRVDPGVAGWADLVAAALDGFEVVITRVPPRLDAGTLRRVQHRVQAREAVLIAIGEPGRLAAELTMEASTPRWEGVEHGSGRLRGRRVTVEAGGRRVPRQRRVELWLPGPDGTMVTAAVEPAPVELRPVG